MSLQEHHVPSPPDAIQHTEGTAQTGARQQLEAVPKSVLVISTAGRNLTVVLSVIPNEVRNLDMDG